MESTWGLETIAKDHEVELVIKAQDGSKIAFDALFHQHKAFVYRVCYGMIGSQDDAVDAAQSAFVDAYRHIRQFRGESGFRTWLYRIAINACNNHLRRESRHRRLSIDPGIVVETGGSADRVWETILKLRADMRSVLVLFYFEGLTCVELAEALACSEGTARARLHRARIAFKKMYLEVDS